MISWLIYSDKYHQGTIPELGVKGENELKDD
jgi:hypothetical protein